ncbi:hypothetical protein FPV67DRAFT_1671430 [Lyophyllum atratum]|nr:hypothetical protein FPV67DRAFT_1671430 [Lyophyllum atratum]
MRLKVQEPMRQKVQEPMCQKVQVRQLCLFMARVPPLIRTFLDAQIFSVCSI